MAIQFAYSDDKDNDYPAAYARIEEINTHFQDRRAHMTVIVYKSQTAMQNNKRAVGNLPTTSPQTPARRYQRITMFSGRRFTMPRKLTRENWVILISEPFHHSAEALKYDRKHGAIYDRRYVTRSQNN